MKSTRRRLILIAVVSLLVVFVLAGGALAFLLSQAGSNFVLRLTRSQLAERFQTQMEYSEGRLRLLNGLYLKDLHLVTHRPGLDLDIRIPELRLDYTISLFQRSLEIERLNVVQPNLHIALSETPMSQAPTPAPLKENKNFLSEPALSLHIRDLRVEKMQLDFRQSDGLKAQLRDTDLKLQADVVAGKLSAQGGFDLAGDVSQSLKTQKLERQLSTQFNGKGQWNVEVNTSEHGPLQINLKPSDAHFALSHLSLNQKQQGQSQKVVLNQADFDLHSALAEQLTAKLNARLHQLALPGTLAHPADLEWELRILGTRTLSEFNAESDLQLAGLKLLQLSGSGHQATQKSGFSGHLVVESQPGLVALLPAVQLLKRNPHLKSDIDFSFEADAAMNIKSSAKIAVPEVRLNATPARVSAEFNQQSTWDTNKRHLDLIADVKLTHQDFGVWETKSHMQLDLQMPDWQTSGLTELQQISPGNHPLPAEVQGAIRVEHHLSKTANGRLDVQLKANLPKVDIPGTAKLGATEINLDLHSQDPAGKTADLKMTVQQDKIELAPRPGFTLRPLSGLNLAIKGQIRDGQQLALPEIKVDVDHGLFMIKGEATGNLASKDFQLNSTIKLNVPSNFPQLSGASLSGVIQMPVTLAVYRGYEMTVETDLSFQDFSYKKNDVIISQINGHVPVSEKLNWDGRHIHFIDLITENPFERVDFNRVRPLLSSNEQLRVEKVHWQEKTYGPFIGFFSVRQNMLSAHQFDMDLNGGRVYGEVFFNIYPGNLQMGFLGRLSGLNLTEFLPSEFLKGQDSQARDLSARVGMVCNINRSTLEGRMDVTEIGGRQLIALMNTLDPNYHDEKMNKIRGLLQLGYPTGINAAFSEGFMDMDIDLKVLTISTRESVRGIPVTGFISKAMSGIVQQTEKGILQ